MTGVVSPMISTRFFLFTLQRCRISDKTQCEAEESRPPVFWATVLANEISSESDWFGKLSVVNGFCLKGLKRFNGVPLALDLGDTRPRRWCHLPSMPFCFQGFHSRSYRRNSHGNGVVSRRPGCDLPGSHRLPCFEQQVSAASHLGVADIHLPFNPHILPSSIGVIIVELRCSRPS